MGKVGSIMVDVMAHILMGVNIHINNINHIMEDNININNMNNIMGDNINISNINNIHINRTSMAKKTMQKMTQKMMQKKMQEMMPTMTVCSNKMHNR